MVIFNENDHRFNGIFPGVCPLGDSAACDPVCDAQLHWFHGESSCKTGGISGSACINISHAASKDHDISFGDNLSARIHIAENHDACLCLKYLSGAERSAVKMSVILFFFLLEGLFQCISVEFL